MPFETSSNSNRLRETAHHERPQERLVQLGPTALADTELLAMVVRNGTQGQDVMTLASKLIHASGSLAGLVGWKEADYRRHKGIGRVKALQLMATMEIARRVMGQPLTLEPVLDQAEGVASYMAPFVAGLEVEKFWVLCLNRKGRLIRRVEVTSGTASSTLVHPREVFREAIREAASGIICVHNHPSGDPGPSSQDIRITRSLREAANAVEITLVDHVIMGRPEADPQRRGYYSFRAAGVL
ncbi:MAG: DNA repair protein RadC [Opitutaceae bacterium]|nr:DNA repair protein RadC [Opitutaceae bacterium]